METKEKPVVVDGFEAADMIAQKAAHRREIDEKREAYLEEGGTIKRYVPPYILENYIECDIHIPGEGATQSEPGIKDTKVRKPRPPKKFVKKA
jgi:hypothetical protein